MSLRGRPVEESVVLPDGRTAVVRIAVPDDDYVPRRELDTVALELFVDGHTEAALNTVLDPDEDSQARELAREIVSRLGSGDLEPTAGAIEPLVDQLR